MNSRIAVAGLFVALGILLPFATGHAFGVPGNILLPMHIPVLLCGLLCGPQLGMLCGLLTPVLSCLLTGMPAAYPMLPIMAAQLLVLGLVSGLAYQKGRLSVYPALLLSILCGWVVYGLVFALLLYTGNGALQALSVTAAVAKGLPGLAVQLVLIPLLLKALSQARLGAPDAAAPGGDTLKEARQLIRSGKASCVVIQYDTIVHMADGRGVSPLLKLYKSSPELLKGALVVDKIIGKAAAMILLLAGAEAIHGEVMSASARDYLQKHSAAHTYGRCVDVITARDKTGICPIEKSVLEIDDPQEGLEAIQATLAVLMKPAG